MLTGRSASPVEGLVFYDAWEVAGAGGRHHMVEPQPARRDRPVPRSPVRLRPLGVAAPGAAGHPVRCELLGVVAPEAEQISDHYGVLADLRY